MSKSAPPPPPHTHKVVKDRKSHSLHPCFPHARPRIPDQLWVAARVENPSTSEQKLNLVPSVSRSWSQTIPLRLFESEMREISGFTVVTKPTVSRMKLFNCQMYAPDQLALCFLLFLACVCISFLLFSFHCRKPDNRIAKTCLSFQFLNTHDGLGKSKA